MRLCDVSIPKSLGIQVEISLERNLVPKDDIERACCNWYVTKLKHKYMILAFLKEEEGQQNKLCISSSDE